MTTVLDLIAAAAALAACVALGLRAYMLKPAYCRWTDAPARVWIALLGLSFLMLGVFCHLVRHGGASEREAVALAGLAVAAVAMLVNLARQGRGAASPRDEKVWLDAARQRWPGVDFNVS